MAVGKRKLAEVKLTERSLWIHINSQSESTLTRGHLMFHRTMGFLLVLRTSPLIRVRNRIRGMNILSGLSVWLSGMIHQGDQIELVVRISNSFPLPLRI